jgi:phosphohistidine swiveling domain-containing protein
MTSPATGTLRCNDGTEIPFEWVYPDAADYEWEWNRSHWPRPATPMMLALQPGYRAGTDRAWQEIEMEPLAYFRRFQWAGPFQYVRVSPYGPERMAQIAARYGEVAQRFGNRLGFWQQYCQPRIEGVCRDLAAAPDDAPISTLAEAWGYGWHQTFTSAAILGLRNMALTALLAESAGDDAALIALEVTQGGDNASQEIDAEIYNLAALARRTPAVRRLLAPNAQDDRLAALRREPAAAGFVAAFDALIERHGARSQGWDIAQTTWREEPEAPLALIRAQLESEGVSHAELAARSAARRAQATAAALAKLPAGKHAEFRQVVADLEGYVTVREGRAYWQMVITGEMRGLLLRRGARLVAAGRTDRADDVLFLVPADFEAGGTSDLRGLVADRRHDWERLCRLVPADFIGTRAEAPAVAAIAPDQLRGAPASRGHVTGPARILHSVEDGASLRPGEIVVCVMTTPSWTPLFAIGGGVITETGGALSHPAITAREYGIPCVVAVKDATTRIRDGQTVTIDGGSGVITLGA